LLKRFSKKNFKQNLTECSKRRKNCFILKELEGNIGFVKALDAQSKLTNLYPEVEKIMDEKQEVKVDKTTDPFYISDASDSDVSTSSEEELLKKRQEAIDLRVAELIKLFNSKDGEDDMPQEDQKADLEKN